MWICLNDAFVSVVGDGMDRGLVVRARKREHLARLFPVNRIVASPRTRDYAWRVRATREEVAKLLAERALNLDYDNFKDSVRDDALHDLYLSFWTLHKRYQSAPPRKQQQRRLPR